VAIMHAGSFLLAPHIVNFMHTA